MALAQVEPGCEFFGGASAPISPTIAASPSGDDREERRCPAGPAYDVPNWDQSRGHPDRGRRRHPWRWRKRCGLVRPFLPRANAALRVCGWQGCLRA